MSAIPASLPAGGVGYPVNPSQGFAQAPDDYRAGPEMGADIPLFPDFNNFNFEEIAAKYAGQPITPELLQMFAQDIGMLGMYGEFQQMEYQDAYLDHLENQLGFNEAQLDQARQQLEFQTGPYWEWYTGPYFDFMQQDSENKAKSSELRTKSDQFNSLSAFYNASAAEARLQQQLAEDPRGIRASQVRFGTPVGY